MEIQNKKREIIFETRSPDMLATLQAAIRKRVVLKDMLLQSYTQEFAGEKLAKLKAPGASIINVNFRYADLRGADFTGAEIKHCDFCGAKLDGAVFRNARVTDSQFREREVSGVDFDGAYFGKEGAKLAWDGPTVFYEDPRTGGDD